MVRSFDGTPIDPDWLDELCATALWAPTAGNTAGVRMYPVGTDLVADYFDVATDAEWRAASRRAPGLLRAGAVVIVTSRPQDYLVRYGEEDKQRSGLGSPSAWTIPYWHTDAAMATMALLLLVEANGWQAALWGNFRRDADVMAWAGITDEQLFGSVLIGRGDASDVPSSSLSRAVPPRRARVRRVGT